MRAPTPTRYLGLCVLVVSAAALLGGCRPAPERDVLLVTTTSTENSGLLAFLLPELERQSDYRVRVVAVGSGAALRLGEQGDADVILAHAPDDELAFVEAGYGIDRTRVMHNDFVIVGPPTDPAGIRDLSDAAEALRRVAGRGTGFVSRGDDSGTHKMERDLWEEAGLGIPVGEPWYIETGQGMGATLTIATERDAYTLTDRGTWLDASDPEMLPVLVEGDERLLNVYHVIVVNPRRHRINEAGAQALRRFLVAPETQQMIGEFGRDRYGQPLFVPSAE